MVISALTYVQECILEAILTQKKLIKAHELSVARRVEEEKAEQEKARQEARERVLADFEKSQNGLGARKLKANPSSTATAEGSAESQDNEDAGGAEPVSISSKPAWTDIAACTFVRTRPEAQVRIRYERARPDGNRR